jgi:hypothetical protein
MMSGRNWRISGKLQQCLRPTIYCKSFTYKAHNPFPKNFGLDFAIIILPILTCDVDIAGNRILLRGHGDKKQGREIVFW